MTPSGNSSISDGERAVEAVDLGDAVADLDDRADAARLDAGVERVDGGLDDAGDLVGSDGHGADLLEGARDELVPQPLEATPDAPVDQAVADADDEPAEQAGIDLDVERDAAAGDLLQPRGQRPDLVLGELGTRTWRWRG